MSALSVVILVFAGVAYFTYRRFKDFPRIAISAAFNRYDYDHVLELLDGVGTKKLLGEYEHDQLLLKAYFMAGKKEEFLQQIKKISETTYKREKAIELLEPWFHNCLRCQAKEFADAFLQAIKGCADSTSIRLSELSYLVLIDHEDSHLEEIEQLISKQKQADFHVGLLYYLKGATLFHTDLNASLHAYDSAMFNFEADQNLLYEREAKRIIDQYGNETYLHYGKQDIPTLIQAIKDIDVGERYRMDSKKSKRH